VSWNFGSTCDTLNEIFISAQHASQMISFWIKDCLMFLIIAFGLCTNIYKTAKVQLNIKKKKDAIQKNHRKIKAPKMVEVQSVDRATIHVG
jgi:hypothetical protein